MGGGMKIKGLSKKKSSKVTVKCHHKHRPMTRREAKAAAPDSHILNIKP
jgi:hypothetical protein